MMNKNISQATVIAVAPSQLTDTSNDVKAIATSPVSILRRHVPIADISTVDEGQQHKLQHKLQKDIDKNDDGVDGDNNNQATVKMVVNRSSRIKKLQSDISSSDDKELAWKEEEKNVRSTRSYKKKSTTNNSNSNNKQHQSRRLSRTQKNVLRVGPVRRSRRLDPSAQEYVAVVDDVPEVSVDDTTTIEQQNQKEEVVEVKRLLQFSRSRDDLYEYQQKEEVALINETWFNDHNISLAPNKTRVKFNNDNMEDIRYIGGLKDRIDPKMVELEPLIEQMKKTYPFRFEIGSTLQVLLHDCNTYQFLGEIYSLEEKLERLVDDEWRALHSQAFSGVLDEIKIKAALRLEEQQQHEHVPIDNTSTNNTLTIINNSTIERVIVNHVEQCPGLLADEEEKVVINNNSKQDGIRDWLGAGLLLMAVTSRWDSSDTIQVLTVAACIYIAAAVIPKIVSSTSTLLGHTARGTSRAIYIIITLLCKIVSATSTLVVYTGREVVSSISSLVAEGVNHVKWQRILADLEAEPQEVVGNNNSKQEGIGHWFGTGLLIMAITRSWESTTTVQVLTVTACIYITMSLLCKMLSSISSLVVDVGRLIWQALQHLTSSACLIGCIRYVISTYDAMIDIFDWLGLESVADTLFSLKSWVVRQLNRAEGAGLDLLEWVTSRHIANNAQRMVDSLSRKIHTRAVTFDAHDMVHHIPFKPDVSWSIDTMANWNYFQRHYIYLFVKGWCKEMQQGLLHPDLCEILVDMEKYILMQSPSFLVSIIASATKKSKKQDEITRPNFQGCFSSSLQLSPVQ